MKLSTPTRIVTTEEMRLLDQLTAAEFGLPSRLLMENAGAAVAREVRRRLRPPHKAVVVCGPGNNGGDGLVAARHLANAGGNVEVVLLTEALKGDALANLEAYRKLGGAARLLDESQGLGTGRGDLVVDAVFGIGLSRPAEGRALAAIEQIRVARELGARVLAVDLPSGLDSDSGRPCGPCVTADCTVTFGYIKRGLALEPGASLGGELVIADISIPRLAGSRLQGPKVFLLREDEIRAVLPPREAYAHKGQFGHVLVIAGSPGKSGAAAMACAAALRGGCGLVTVAARPKETAAVQAFMPEIMAHPLPGSGPLGLSDLPALLEASQGKSVIAAGPGLLRGPETGHLLGRLLFEAKLPAVLDADALNALADKLELLTTATGPLILTPHPGEMARLIGKSVREVQEDRIGVARRFSEQYRLTVVLKGARTVIADVAGATAINPTGNPGMATAGSGDVLTGLCAALAGQGMTPGSAACAAVFVHGMAGDRARRKRGSLGIVATDLLEAMTEVWAKWAQ